MAVGKFGGDLGGECCRVCDSLCKDGGRKGGLKDGEQGKAIGSVRSISIVVAFEYHLHVR